MKIYISHRLMERFSVKVITEATLGYQSNAFSDEENVILRYMQAAHDSASAENLATGLASKICGIK